MHVAVERRVTYFAEHPDPTRELWVGFVEVMVRFADGRQAIDVHAFDEGHVTEAAALAAAEAWIAQYNAGDGAGGAPITIARL